MIRFEFQIEEAVIKEDLCGKLRRRHAALGAFPSVECSDDGRGILFFGLSYFMKSFSRSAQC